MNPVVWILLCIAAAAFGAGAAWLAAGRGRLAERAQAAERGQAKAEAAAAALRGERDQSSAAATRLQAELEAEKKRGQERLADLESARAGLMAQFKALAQEILEDKSRRFTEANKTNIEAILKPLSERIGEFRKQVAESYHSESQDRAGLAAEIRQLKGLHQQMSEDAKRLTSALKGDSKVQGGWGEVILARLFETCGLTRGREYDLQVNLADGEGGRQLPDAIVHLPEGRDIVVDAKASLTAYERLHAAEDEAERAAHLAEHLRSLRSHVDRLAAKDYPGRAAAGAGAGIDFVLMFVPIEAAYLEAVRADVNLHDYALRKKVVLLSPASMLPTLRVVEHMWRVDSQNRNAQTIAEEAGKLYDKFVGFVGDIETLGQRLRQADNAYQGATNKLYEGRANLVRQAERLRDMGAAAKKSLGDAGARPRQALADDEGGVPDDTPAEDTQEKLPASGEEG